LGLYIGCSGYFYWHWRGRFYPEDLPPSRFLTFYGERFNALEVNSTFYRFPTPSSLKTLKKKLPEIAFVFKAPREITHLKTSKEREKKTELFFSLLKDILQENLKKVLFQFPPSFTCTEENLHWILSLPIPPPFVALEFRHPSFFTEEKVVSFLRSGMTIVTGSGKGLPETIYPHPTVYLRFHGKTSHKDSYSKEELSSWVKRIKEITPENLFVFFNNDGFAYAPFNALTFREILAEAG